MNENIISRTVNRYFLTVLPIQMVMTKIIIVITGDSQ